MHQLNMQEPEELTRRADGIVELAGDPFYTIQGECVFAGHPAVFVRLAGCNLQCPDCDTDYTGKRRWVAPMKLVNDVGALFPDSAGLWKDRLVVITGGEPFRQNIAPFVRELLTCGYKVQVETNGTLYLEEFPYAGDVTLVVSPKVGNVNDRVRPYVRHLKYVVEAGKQHERTRLPLVVLGNTHPVAQPWNGFRGTVWVQPSDQQNDECNKANLEACVAAAMEHGYRVSIQTHKIMGVA